MENYLNYKNFINNKINLFSKNLLSENLFDNYEKIISLVTNVIKNNNKIFFAGNGGSASDSSHFAGEFVGRFFLERRALPAISLSADNSIITSIGNDYDFSKIFERQLYALGNEGDLIFLFSTSGKSKNIIELIKAAKKIKIHTILFTGLSVDSSIDCDYLIKFNSNSTPEIQELTYITMHYLCMQIEKNFVKKNNL